MKYEEMIKTLANNGMSELEREDILIREMARLVEDLLHYRYVVTHETKGTIVEDSKNLIKKSATLVQTDLSMLIEQLGLTDDVRKRSEKRLNKLINKGITEENAS